MSTGSPFPIETKAFRPKIANLATVVSRGRFVFTGKNLPATANHKTLINAEYKKNRRHDNPDHTNLR